MMKSWEDTIKEKLEGYESPLPNGSYEAFLKRRNAASRSFISKKNVWVWTLAGAAAVAMVGFILLKPIAVTQESLPIRQQVTAKTEPSTSIQENIIIPEKGAETKPARSVLTPNMTTTNVEEERGIAVKTDVVSEGAEAPVAENESAIPEDSPTQTDKTPGEVAPIIPAKVALETNRFKGGTVAGSVLGLGVLGTLTATITNKTLKGVGFPVIQDDGPGGYGAPDQLVDAKHFLPLKLGASARIAITERLYFTTGMDYTLYSSVFSSTYNGSGRSYMQHIHYLGLPLRLDWTLFSGKWLDVYVGAGLEGSVCVSARFDGRDITKNPATLSFLGAGGVQLNLTRRWGLFIDPQLSYTLPLGTVYQKTYQTEHPFMFSVSSGLRITIGK